jgi:pimeloyl-ACP methyl ester carboxylesterase
MPKPHENMADYMLPLNINGLQGRMLRLPPPKGQRREIMYIYGHHASLERNFGVAEYLNRYGGVTVPDLPGFGGMDPFYKIGKKPTLDNMADYLAAFIKLRYKKKKFTLTGLSLGFVIITRMLQKYPELNKQVEYLVSFAGFAHKDDFKYKKSTYYLLKLSIKFFSLRLVAAFIKYVVFRGPFIRFGYAVFEPLFVKA